MLTAACAAIMVGFVILLLNLRRFAEHSSESDPKNEHYLLWKKGLYPLNPDVALEAMIGDPDRDGVVLGKSRQDLERKFGYLTPIEREHYLKMALERNGWQTSGSEPMFVLGNSDWVVVFSGGRASKLILLKGS